MKITKENLSNVIFENQDARLLIEDVVTHTGANLYYYGEEITIMKAIEIWRKAYEALEDEKIIVFHLLIQMTFLRFLCSSLDKTIVH